MQNGMAWVWGIIIAIILLGGGYYLWSTFQGSTATPQTTSDNGASGTSLAGSGAGNNTDLDGDGVVDEIVSGSADVEVSTIPMNASVSYSGSSFSPKTVTIKKGGTVTWTNDSTGKMWVASAQHPSHTAYAGTSRAEHCPDASKTAFDQCQGGDAYSFTFDKVGTWNYHDHINASALGTVVVVE